jgi:hypothetical protein
MWTSEVHLLEAFQLTSLNSKNIRVADLKTSLQCTVLFSRAGMANVELTYLGSPSALVWAAAPAHAALDGFARARACGRYLGAVPIRN